MAQITITIPDELVQPLRDLLVAPGQTVEEAALFHLKFRAAQVALDAYAQEKDTEYKQLVETERQALQQNINARRDQLAQQWGV